MIEKYKTHRIIIATFASNIYRVKQIIQTGPQAIFNTFGRKISMNLKLAKSSVWVNILLVGIAVIGIFIFRPSRHMKNISNKYPMIFKGFIASYFIYT